MNCDLDQISLYKLYSAVESNPLTVQEFTECLREYVTTTPLSFPLCCKLLYFLMLRNIGFEKATSMLTVTRQRLITIGRALSYENFILVWNL